MRIIAGTKKGMKLFAPKTNLTRSVTDRVKESIFDILNCYGFPKNKSTADLFSGVGSMGLEALSRGARFVSFVERNDLTLSILKKNIIKAGFTDKCKVLRGDAYQIGAPPRTDNQKYELVFTDPPYRDTDIKKADSPLDALLKTLSTQIASGAIVVVRTSVNAPQLAQYPPLKIIDERCYGNMLIRFLIKQHTTEPERENQ